MARMLHQMHKIGKLLSDISDLESKCSSDMTPSPMAPKFHWQNDDLSFSMDWQFHAEHVHFTIEAETSGWVTK